ncbi:MFS transporter [Acinetobacter guillouiae]|uniref:MFS transporter n=1 Tax=Acinetobacter guillouiae TaxID=106649 RepID=UPI003AF485A9
MIGPYRELFFVAGTQGFALAGLLARIALPMTGIGIIVMLSQMRGSYALAGGVSAVFVLTYALVSPQVSKLVDQYGQSRILPIVTTISSIGLLVLVFASWWRAADWTLFVGALLAGFMPSISAMVRARWTAIYAGQAQLQTAYSLETVLDEVTFIIGPPLSVGLSIAVLPQASLLVATLLLIIGVFLLVLQRGTEPQIDTQYLIHKRSGSIIMLVQIHLLTLLMVGMGIIVGTIDIVSVAFAEHLGQPAAASLVLSAYALSSCLAGLLFGAVKLKMSLQHLLLLGGVATAASTLPLLWVNSITMLASSVLLAGVFFAPTMIVAMALVERIVPKHRLTEGMTWLLAGLNVGVALGAAISGQMVDGYGLRSGFLVALCAGGMVLVIVLWGHYRMANDSIDNHSIAISNDPS